MGVKPGGTDIMSQIADWLLYRLLQLWNHPRMKGVRKLLYNFKLTVICGIITLLVFRGTVGAGKFGTLQNDVEMVNLELKSFQENILLQSAESQKLLWEESIEPSGPYSIGPPIRDWDDQRGKFIAADPGSNETIAGKPLVMIVSGSQPTPCEYNVGDHLHVKFLKTKLDYARIKGMKIYYHMVRFDKEMTGLWAKLPLLRRLMVAHPEIEWFWWMDPDAAITDHKFEMPWAKYKDYNLVVPGWDELVYKEKDWVGLSTGSFLLRNCQWSLDLLDAWSKMGVKGKARNEAGKLLTASLKGRPDIPADDQSALVHLMITDKPRWGGKIHLESKYYLHGYWVNLVDKFDKMLTKSHPGYGDDRWPFVVHFVGCQLCGASGEYDVKRCINEMSRAFNFADNQVIKPYGYKHLRLNSSVLLPTAEITRVTIVETHFQRKKLQKTRKEKVGVKAWKDSMVPDESLDSNPSDSLPPATQILVDELLAEGVLALTPGSTASSGVNSLQVVPTKERMPKNGGQSAASGPGQSVADWRDNVEGIEEEELQEKRLEEAESSRLLQQEGKFLKEREAEEAGAGEVESSSDLASSAPRETAEAGDALDRLQTELTKKGEKVTSKAEGEEEVEGLDVGSRAAQEEELDRVMRSKEGEPASTDKSVTDEKEVQTEDALEEDTEEATTDSVESVPGMSAKSRNTPSQTEEAEDLEAAKESDASVAAVSQRAEGVAALKVPAAINGADGSDVEEDENSSLKKTPPTEAATQKSSGTAEDESDDDAPASITPVTSKSALSHSRPFSDEEEVEENEVSSGLKTKVLPAASTLKLSKSVLEDVEDIDEEQRPSRTGKPVSAVKAVSEDDEEAETSKHASKTLKHQIRAMPVTRAKSSLKAAGDDDVDEDAEVVRKSTVSKEEEDEE